MKKTRLFLLGIATVVGATFAGASYDAATSTLTLDGVMTNVTAEADLGSATKVVLANSGGVAFAESVSLAKTYSISGDGLAATGVVSVAAGKTVSPSSKAALQQGILGHTFVKRGAGTLNFPVAFGAISPPTRLVVEEGCIVHSGGDLFGNHSGTTLNCTIDVREGAEYCYANGVGHSPMGPLELTGGAFRALTYMSDTTFWANTAFKGGVVAHACATPSVIFLNGRAHLGHCEYSNIVFNVETGARLIIDGVLTNGYTSAEQPSSLVKRGGGELVLLRNGGWTGGTVIEEGTVTVAHRTALGTHGVKLAGNATLNVLPGLTLECGALAGAGTLTKTGAGGVVFSSVAEGVTVTRAEGEGTVPTAFVDGVVHLGGGSSVINVPAGETWQVTEFVAEDIGYESIAYDIQKRGAGTLVLPNSNNAASFRNLSVEDGMVRFAAENNFGSGTVTVADGAVLAPSAGMTISAHTVQFKGTSYLDVPENTTFAVGSNWLSVASATLVKRGGGTLSFNQLAYNVKCVNDATRIVCDEGRLQFNQDPFGGHSVASKTTVECHEGTTMLTTGHSPFGHIVLRGATMKVNPANRNLMGVDARLMALEADMVGQWHGFSLNGTIEVLPAAGGAESTIDALRCYLAHVNNQTVFDVKEGATLRVKSRLRDGFDAAASEFRPSGFTKTGGGEMILERAVDTTGVIHLQKGTLTLAAEGSLPDAAKLDVTPNATLRLADRAATGAGASTFDPLLATADVWFDAVRLSQPNGASVATAPNLGTSGGSFKLANANAPTFKTNAINGLSAIHCEGNMGLVLDSYTNYTANLTVFMVAQWTSWDDNGGAGGKGRWGGGLSMSYYAATDNDNATAYSYHTETSGTIGHTSSSAPSIAAFAVTNPNRTIGAPYLDMITYVTNMATFAQYVGDGVADAVGRSTMAQGVSFKIDRVAIGGRLKGAGQFQCNSASATDGNNRMYIGDIGEVVVFTRVLTPAEHEIVTAYLKRKWFNSSVTAAEAMSSEGASLVLDVPEGTGGFAGAVASSSVNSAATLLRKTGAGTLALRASGTGAAGQVALDEGTLALSGEAIASRAEVWMDATDAATLTFDANDKVTAVRNKGRAGGAFGQCPGRYNNVVPYPTYLADAINGNGALVFDTNAGLQLTSYTNATSPRSIHIYAVLQGHGGDLAVEGKGKWGGPFSLYDSRQTGDDQNTTGSFQLTETLTSDDANGTNRVSKYMGKNSRQDVLPPGRLQEPYLFVAHNEDNGAVFAYEWSDTDPTQVLAYGMESSYAMSSTRVNLGGRSTTGGALQWESNNATPNRTWAGYIGELVIVTRTLSRTEEAALLAYLRKKWLARGDGSAVAPAFLSGDYGAPSLAGMGLACADGTKVEVAGAPVALASLATTGTVDWTRVWEGLDAANAALFTVAGDVSLGAVHLDVAPKPTQDLPVLTWGGAALTSPVWTVTSAGAGTGARVGMRGSAYWLSAGGMVIYVR